MTDASPATNVFVQNPFLALSTKIVGVYSEAIRQNMEYLSVSSARIIQEQAIKAWTDAVQSCSKALAENAMSSQQQAMERIADANRTAFEMLASGFSPFKMPPMAGLAEWFPAMPDAASMSNSRRAR